MTYYRSYILQEKGDPQCQCPSPDGSTAMGLFNERVENLAAQVRATFDINEQAGLLQQMEQIHWDEMQVIMPITITPEFTLIRTTWTSCPEDGILLPQGRGPQVISPRQG